MAPGLVFGVNVAGDKDEFEPGLWTDGVYNNGSNTDSCLPERHPKTGIDVLIVGAGMGGLMATLECWRKGHNIVGILERNDGPVYSGE
jgi:NADPH-dependent 2,4-dienoyl-CoA reductase/sulfur reductase-like enzyme